MAVATGLAACGGNDDDSGSGAAASTPAATAADGGGSASTTTATGKQPTGEPIKAMTIAAVNWNGPAYPNILETAKLYEKWINAHGGIAGRPLQVQTCDEMGDPNTLATCGRKAIADGVVAVVGSFTLTGDRITPILDAGKTAWFGISSSVSPAERNSPVTFEFGPGQAVQVAQALDAVDRGCKKIGYLTLDTPGKTVGIQLEQATLATRGMKLAKTVAIPVSAQDYSPQAAQITSGTDCIIGAISETNWASFLPAFAQTGSKAKLFGLQGNLDTKVAKKFPQQVAGGVAADYFADLATPAYADFRAAIAQYHPPTDMDYNSGGALGAWAAYTGFKDIIEKMQGPVTNATFLAAAHASTDVDTGGMVPNLDFTKPFVGAPDYLHQLYNRSVTFSTFDGEGNLTPVGAFKDMTKTLLAVAPK
jgi:ABC-type branched-subunit amino acid transport system substrate-binding protein